MTEAFLSADLRLKALFAALFMWFLTAVGAAAVFFFKRSNEKVLSAMLGFAAGVMLAASFWSLLAPAEQMADQLGQKAWAVMLAGLSTGGALLCCGDKLFDNIMQKYPNAFIGKKRSLMLIAAITLHNIPEGLAVGVAFASSANEGAALIGAIMLAFGIALQNLPEGAAVSVPLCSEGMSKAKAFFFGQLSGAVEPVAAYLGAALALYIKSALPFMLSFAAGAMIYVVAQELLPETHLSENPSLSACYTLLGFAVMMAMDVGLG